MVVEESEPASEAVPGRMEIVLGERRTGDGRRHGARSGAGAGAAREVRLGWRLTPAARGGTGFEVSLDATRRESAADGAEHGMMVRSRTSW